MDTYNQETIFHLPGLFRYFDVYKQILDNMEASPQCFKDNVKIGSIYGCPNCIWNGGRLMLAPPLSKTRLLEIKEYMLHRKVPARFTFTNCLLEEKHTYDTYCNMLLEIFNTKTNEVICNKDVLEQYIRKNYKDNYKYISSTTKRLETTDEQQKELKKDYYLVVLDYDHNKDFEYLQSIENKEKCELLCNAVCQPRCSKRLKHYEIISQCQLENDDALMNGEYCAFAANDNLQTAMMQKNFISPDDINSTYLPMGFKNFKLEGRTMAPLDFIEVLLYYLIKEEYKPMIRRYLQQIVW